MTAQQRTTRRGYILVAFSLSLVVLLGIAGLAIDIGRMYAAHAESQTFCDAAALYAAKELNGLDSGIDAAVGKVDALKPEKLWAFHTQRFENVVVKFATAPKAPASDWKSVEEARAAPTNLFFAKVTTTVAVPLTLLPVLVPATSSNVVATAVAGRSDLPSGIQDGVLPFSPFSHVGCPDANPADPFGMWPGRRYTLRWTSGSYKGGRDTTDPYNTGDIQYFCPGDKGADGECMMNKLNAAGPNYRGYIEFSNSADIRASILGEMSLPRALQIGMDLNMTTGERNTENRALSDLVDADTDPETMPYGGEVDTGIDPTYTGLGQGNGRRIVPAPVNGGAPNFTIVGFGGFFLDGRTSPGGGGAAYPSGSTAKQPVCAEYIGTATLGSAAGGGGGGPLAGPTVYKLRLYQ